MKTIKFLIIIIFATIINWQNVFGQTTVTIGTGTTTTINSPFNEYYKFDWSNMIFLKSEINTAGSISQISFYIDTYAGSGTAISITSQKIYMAHTSSTTLGTGKPDPTSMTLVFDGNISYTGTGWFNVTLSTPFTYNNSDNLQIYTENSNNTETNDYPRYRYTATTGNNRTTYGLSSFSLPASGTATEERPNIKITLNAIGYTVSGTLKYANTATTSLTSQTVKLMDGATEVASTTTNGSGEYTFSNIANGTYTVTPNLSNSWGGVTAMDVTRYLKHSVGDITLTGLPFASGDVNASSTVTSADATLIMQKIVDLSPSPWPSHSFVYSSGAVTVSGANQTVNIQALCFGDANASYSFAKNELEPINYEYNDLIFYDNNQNFIIPISVKSVINNLSSITLEIAYNSDAFDITEIELSQNNSSLRYTITDGIIKIVYSNLNAINYSVNDILFYIKGTTKNIINQTQIINSINGEFGDFDDNIISDITLSIPYVSPMVSNEEINLNNISIYPNPADQFLYINNAQNSTLKIFDVFGNLIIEKQITESITIIELNNLEIGTYYIKIQKNNYEIVKKFIKM